MDNLEKDICKEINIEIKRKKYQARNFGNNIESNVQKLLKKFFLTIDKSSKCAEPKGKNETFDYTIHNCKNKNYAIDIKVANKKEGPANDLGTISDWIENLKGHKKQYSTNIYFVWLEYEAVKGVVTKIDNVYIDKIFKYLAFRKKKDHNGDQLLQYREKDGNLRPKTWNKFRRKENVIKNFKTFENLLCTTSKYRSYTIAVKHLKNIEKDAYYIDKIREIILK